MPVPCAISTRPSHTAAALSEALHTRLVHLIYPSCRSPLTKRCYGLPSCYSSSPSPLTYYLLALDFIPTSQSLTAPRLPPQPRHAHPLGSSTNTDLVFAWQMQVYQLHVPVSLIEILPPPSYDKCYARLHHPHIRLPTTSTGLPQPTDPTARSSWMDCIMRRPSPNRIASSLKLTSTGEF